MHSHPEAIAAQETYLHGLVKHVNPYTGLAYKDDPSIVGFEINNEPCHSGTKEEVKAYINRMLKAINKTGNRKPVFYNVSHNGYVVEAYYETAIQGTTYQWYPIGLVSGQTQQGNFLPYIDNTIMTEPTIRFSNQMPLTLNHFLSFPIIYVMPNHQRTAPNPMQTMPNTSSQNECSGSTKPNRANNPI